MFGSDNMVYKALTLMAVMTVGLAILPFYLIITVMEKIGEKFCEDGTGSRRSLTKGFIQEV